MSEVERVKRRWEKGDNADIDSAIKALLQAGNGRRFLWWLLAVGKVGTTPFAGDEGRTAFACGELNVGNQIMARLMTVDPDGYVVMMKEQFNERNDRDRELGHASDIDAGRADEFGNGNDDGDAASD